MIDDARDIAANPIPELIERLHSSKESSLTSSVVYDLLLRVHSCCCLIT